MLWKISPLALLHATLSSLFISINYSYINNNNNNDRKEQQNKKNESSKNIKIKSTFILAKEKRKKIYIKKPEKYL